jgi:hypothetical protein
MGVSLATSLAKRDLTPTGPPRPVDCRRYTALSYPPGYPGVTETFTTAAYLKVGRSPVLSGCCVAP